MLSSSTRGPGSKLLEAVDRLEAIEGIRAGLEDVKAGRIVPLEQAFARIKKQLKFPRHRRT